MRVVKITKRLHFQLQSLDDRVLPRIVLVTRSLWKLDLLHSNHLSRCRVQSQINTSISSSTDQFTPYPFERG